MFKFQKYKGMAEEDIKELSFQQLSIFQPYFIKNRLSKSRMEKFRSYLPYFGEGVEGDMLAGVMLKCARDLPRIGMREFDP